MFASKKAVSDPSRSPLLLEPECKKLVMAVDVTRKPTENLLKVTDIRKAIGPDDVSLQVTKQ